jgi:hypothetical protein
MMNMKQCLHSSYATMLATLLVVTGCGGGARSAWDDIDYSKVRGGQARENDPVYTAPTVVGCTDDDLYNCR